MSRSTRLTQRARGVTLVELMISMVLGLLILAAVSAVYLSSRQTFRANDNLARVQENIRTAFDTLTHDIRESAFYGCAGINGGTTDNFLNVLNNNTKLLWDFRNPVFGYEAISNSTWDQTPDPAIASPLPGRDILVVRTVEEGGGPVIAQDTATFTISVPEKSGIAVGDLLLLNNCSKTRVIQATAVTPNAGLDVVTYGLGSQTPGNSTTAIGSYYTASGELRRLVTRVYYIANNAAGLPSLFVLPSNGAAQEIAEGVEDMQISYGIDADKNHAADSYIKASEVNVLNNDWANIVSVSLVLTYISPEDFVATTAQSNAMGTDKDRRMRRQISTIIALRNRAG